MKVVELCFLTLHRILCKSQAWTLPISWNLGGLLESKHLDLVAAKPEGKLLKHILNEEPQPDLVQCCVYTTVVITVQTRWDCGFFLNALGAETEHLQSTPLTCMSLNKWEYVSWKGSWVAVNQAGMWPELGQCVSFVENPHWCLYGKKPGWYLSSWKVISPPHVPSSKKISSTPLDLHEALQVMTRFSYLLVITAQATVSAQKIEKKRTQEGNYCFPAL